MMKKIALVLLALLLAGPLMASPPDLGADLKADDYDSLYALLQKYRDELSAMSAEKEAYAKQVQDLNDKAMELAKQLDSFKPLDGLKIHGSILSYYDDVNSYGAGSTGLESGHFRDAVQRAELSLTYTRGLLRGLVEYDFQYIFGNQYDAETLLGVEQVPVQSGFSQGARQIYVEMLTPLQIRAGYLDYAQTPLTFWRNEDPDPYVPEPFAARRERLRQDLLLSDDHHQELRGLRLLSDESYSFGRILFSGLASQLASQPSDPTNPGINRVYEGAGASPVSMFELYNTYLGAWLLHYVMPSGLIEAGIQGSYLGQDPSGSPVAGLSPPPYEVMVNGASLKTSPVAGVSLNAEYALSHFYLPGGFAQGLDPQFDDAGNLDGSALNAGLKWEFGWLTLKGRLVQVSEGFESPAAQGRTWDASQSPMGPFETENSRFDPESGGFGDIRAPRAPETIYNRALLPPVVYYQTGLNSYAPALARIPSDPSLNSLEPYGDATPNRQHYGGGMALNFFKGGALVTGDYDLGSQVTAQGSLPLENYVRMLLGARLDLKPILGWPLRASGSFGTEDTRDGAWVAFDSAKLQAGLEYDPWKGGTLQLGFRHLDYNGVLPYANPGPFADADPVLASYGREAWDSVYEQWALGLKQELGDGLALWINYGQLSFANGLAGKAASATESRPNFTLEQGYARLALDF